MDYRRPSCGLLCSFKKKTSKRRDFTVTYFALDPDREIIDLFHGLEDLEKQVYEQLEWQERFNEDVYYIHGFQASGQLEAAHEKRRIHSHGNITVDGYP